MTYCVSTLKDYPNLIPLGCHSLIAIKAAFECGLRNQGIVDGVHGLYPLDGGSLSATPSSITQENKERLEWSHAVWCTVIYWTGACSTYIIYCI